jgi:hypothetical protein
MGAIFTCALDKHPLTFAIPISSGVDSGASSEKQFKGFKPYSHDAAPLRTPSDAPAAAAPSAAPASEPTTPPARVLRSATGRGRKRGGAAFQRG